MIESTLKLDVSIIKDYDPLIESVYILNLHDNSAVKEVSFRLDVDLNDYQRFMDRYSEVMIKYKIPADHHGYILFIIQMFYNKRDLLEEYIIDTNDSIEVLKFLLGYANHKQDGKLLGSELQRKNAGNISLSIGNEIKFDYKHSASFVIDAMIRGYKYQTSNFYLAELFREHSELPSIDFLENAIALAKFQIRSPYNMIVCETILQLYDYIEKNIKQTLSKKKQEFTYDLLYLFDLLKELVRDNDSDLKYLKRNKDFTLKTGRAPNKNSFIESTIMNYKRRKILKHTV